MCENHPQILEELSFERAIRQVLVVQVTSEQRNEALPQRSQGLRLGLH